MNKCTECGHCCVVFNCVQVSKFEAETRGLKVVPMKKIFPKKDDKDDGFILKRKKVFWGAIGKDVFICWYFDLDTRLCSIYHNRPNVCRNYMCEYDPKKYTDARDSKVRIEWEALIRGDYAQCLWS